MSNRTRKARKRAKKQIRKTVENLEYGLAKLKALKQHHENRIAKLNTKIAAQEGEIEIAKEEEAEV
jgi:predicted  nucleic acid-binding Zn-ribbon protein